MLCKASFGMKMGFAVFGLPLMAIPPASVRVPIFTPSFDLLGARVGLLLTTTSLFTGSFSPFTF